ncbi:PPOX class F420-dependent oxidoreductase [Actinophytocola sp.]|uniref:PPOX class F420-dependent oxidoreductase n=1 Tax=Actinophytocola sp. TaxID=1872138 RepID=UPI00389A5672
MHHMERDEWLAFVMQGTRTGKLAVVRKDGSPHVAPIWFLVDAAEDGDSAEDYLVFTSDGSSVKSKILRRDPRIALVVDMERPPYSFVQFRAEATISEDLDELLEWATRLGARYMGADRAEEYGKRNAVPGELLVRARITKVVAQADIAH